MDINDTIQSLFKDSDYRLNLFSGNEVEALLDKAFTKTVRGEEVLYVKCVVRDRDVCLKPEEAVRQLYAARLMEHYGYTRKRLAFEYPVSLDREKKTADIVVFDNDRADAVYIIVAITQPKSQNGVDRLRSICNAVGAPIGIWTDGAQISHFHCKTSYYFEEITDIPKAEQSLPTILCDGYTLKDRSISDTEEDMLARKRRKAWHDILKDNYHRRIYIDPNTDMNRLIEEMYDIDTDCGRR